MRPKEINNKGQVLMIVMLMGMIALVITMGMVSKVSRLTKTTVETEEHEAAFSTSEKYSRKILDSFEEGVLLDQNGANALISDEGEADTVSIAVDDTVSSITGVVIGASETYEMAITNPVPGENATLTMEDSDINNVLLTVVFFDGSAYSVQKRLFVSCSQQSGDLSADCPTGTQSITYTYTGNEKSVRFKFLGGDARFTVNNTAGAIANKYTITTTQGFGENAGVQSETVLYVPKTKSMPSLFDYVIFNGTGQIDKSTD